MRFSYETPLGEVWLHGDREPDPSAAGLAVLVIPGAFAGLGRAALWARAVGADVDIYSGLLPGTDCPDLLATSIGAWGAAYAHAAGTAFGHRPLFLIGESAGALVALALRRPNVVHRFLSEPPLVIGPGIALEPELRARAAANPAEREVLFNVFGASPDGMEMRDYRGLLDTLDAPATVLFGGDFKGQPGMYPSLVPEPMRECLRAHPMVTTKLVRGSGHDIMREQPLAALFMLGRAIAAAKQARVTTP